MIKGALRILKRLLVGTAVKQSRNDQSQNDQSQNDQFQKDQSRIDQPQNGQPQTSPSVKERTIQAVEADHADPIHKGPRGGLYRLDAKGRKIYIKQTSPASVSPRQGRGRQLKSSKAS